MRTLIISLALVLLTGCGVEATHVTPADAAAPPQDADVADVVEEPNPGVCTKSNRGLLCIALAEPCDGGTRYSCGGSTCPTDDVGTCELLSEDPNSRVTVTCCQRKACTRVSQVATQCAEFDSTRKVGWHCPPGVKAPAEDCVFNGTPLPDEKDAAEYCCR